jgi:outer membrane protein OmpA-like peptidoglycan-associated protein
MKGKNFRMTVLIASCAIVSACATTQEVPRRVSPHYTAVGAVENARAYIYGNNTVLELADSPFFLSIKDERGETIDYEKMGRYYYLHNRYDKFTASINGRSVTFTTAPATQTHVFSAPLAAPAVSPAYKTKLEPVQLSVDDAEMAALLALTKRQLAEIRRLIETKDKRVSAYDVQAKLEEIERRLITSKSAIVQVQFPRYSTVFNPSPAVAWVLVPAAKDAERINITGYTDSRIAGPLDAEIALNRAEAARDYLIDKGVKAEKINVFSQADDGFIAPNNTKQGRAINRRIEIEIESPRLNRLAST